MYLFVIRKPEKVALNTIKNSKALIEYLNYIQDLFKDIDEYNP